MNFPGWDRKTLRRNALFVLGLIILYIVAYEIIGPNGYLTYRRQKQEYTHLKQQIQVLDEQNQQLEQKIHALKNNPAAVEKQARDQLHLAKPGELIYMLPDEKPSQPSATAQRMPSPPDKHLR